MSKNFCNGWSALLLAVFQAMTVLAQSAASPPAIFLQPQFPIVAVGSNLTFTVVALVPEPLTYKWFFNSTPLEVPDSPSLVLTNLQFTNCGAYSVVVSNRDGAATEATLLTVMRPPVIFACGPCLCSTITPAGQPITNLVPALASAPFTVQWLLNGSVISTIPVPALGNDCAANAAPYSEPLVLIPPLGDNFLEFVMSNAVGQASQLIVVQVLPGGASPAAPANGLPRAVSSTVFSPPCVTLSRGVPGVYTGPAWTGPCTVESPCGTITNGHWCRLSSPYAGLVTVSTEGGSGDTVVGVLPELPIDCPKLIALACTNDVNLANRQRRLQFAAQALSIYYVVVGGLGLSDSVELTYSYDLEIASSDFRADGSFELQSAVVPPNSYIVQASSNLALRAWTQVFTTNLLTTNGFIQFRDTNRAPRQKFYRLAPGT